MSDASLCIPCAGPYGTISHGIARRHIFVVQYRAERLVKYLRQKKGGGCEIARLMGDGEGNGGGAFRIVNT